ncbi:zinc finger protein 57-like isoform X2 [Toxorhynchites rutilus septentrionalis]|uniref:zinc finger protein 57-like isoform X2 n=1 Tax=Toxorhynchites rutilus septentrionalis TaxID=329112 RepID=UPI00247AFF53|nr:zinc finger protein 57-like isoform X2 [Toxorhynchites rutilus septentrionalis]
MPRCAVNICRITSVQAKKDSIFVCFHTFPKDTKRRAKWLKFAGLRKDPGTSLYVCSQHFAPEAFVHNASTQRQLVNYGRNKLIIDAIPTIRIPAATGANSSDRSVRYSRKERKKIIEDILNIHSVCNEGTSLAIKHDSIEPGTIFNVQEKDCSRKSKEPQVKRESSGMGCSDDSGWEHCQHPDDIKSDTRDLELVDKSVIKTLREKFTNKINRLAQVSEKQKTTIEQLRVQITETGLHRNKKQDECNQDIVALRNACGKIQEEVQPCSDQLVKDEAKEHLNKGFTNNQDTLILEEKKRMVWSTDENTRALILRDQCSFCTGMCNKELHHALVPTKHQEQKLKTILQKLSSLSPQLSSYPTCDKCRQEFIIVHNIPESCFKILSSAEPTGIKVEPELMIDDHELSDSDDISETDPIVNFGPVEQETEMHIKEEGGEVFFISEINEEDDDIPLLPVARTNIRRKNRKGKKPFKCEMCEKTFFSKYRLKEHVRGHTDDPPYPCPHCPKGFWFPSGLKQHILTHTGERPFSCSYCPSSFTDPGTLRCHIRIHTGERPYSCPHCPKTFIHSQSLQKHIRAHTGERRYSCSHCPKAFTRPQSLQKHTRTHTGERPYPCPRCPDTFADLVKLKRHIQNHTGERPYSCPHCPKTFLYSSTLKRHRITHGNDTGDPGQESKITVKEEITEC